MLRKFKRLSALALCLTLLMGLLAIPASANYDIYVNAKDGVGLNLRTGPGTEYSKVRSQPIPMYTKLSISQTQDSAAGNPWGYTSYEGVSGWVCLVETTTYDPTPKAPASSSVNTADPLSSIAYIGDRSACKMDAAMAQAYLEAIAGQPTTGQWGGTLQAVLVDAGRDGYPLLMTTYLITENGMYDECDIPIIWEYRNGHAVAHDFQADTDLPSPIQMATDTIAEGKVLRVDSNGGGAVDPVQGSLYYAVNKAQLTLLHTVKEYTDSRTYELDGKGYPSLQAISAQLGWADSLDNALLTTNGSTLFLDCITCDAGTAVTALDIYLTNLSPDDPGVEAETPEDPASEDPETAPTPPPMERTGSAGASIALGIIIFLLVVIVILFVVMITRLKKKH
ncbi:MAG: hypothetical protein IKB65_03980 [Ruminiclostridium sp.]|nr:hypothetical protein [Ruminiclostridium sp.]